VESSVFAIERLFLLETEPLEFAPPEPQHILKQSIKVQKGTASHNLRYYFGSGWPIIHIDLAVLRLYEDLDHHHRG